MLHCKEKIPVMQMLFFTMQHLFEIEIFCDIKMYLLL